MNSPKPTVESPSLVSVARGLALMHGKDQVIILTLDRKAATCEAVGHGTTEALQADAECLAERARLCIIAT